MKIFTALIAAAALAASISVASAAGTMNEKSGSASHNLTATGKAFCSTSKATSATNCNFATMADCEKVAKPEGTCVPNPKAATTGSWHEFGHEQVRQDEEVNSLNLLFLLESAPAQSTGADVFKNARRLCCGTIP